MSIEELKQELERTYRVLRADEAWSQNYRDIKSWEDNNFATPDEALALHNYNNRLWKESRT